jgi:CDP-diglyceride synthetase
MLGNVSFGLLCIIVLIFSFEEYFLLMKRLKINGPSVTSTIMAVVLFIILILFKNDILESRFLFLTPLAFILIMIGQMISKNRNPVTNVAIISFAFI